MLVAGSCRRGRNAKGCLETVKATAGEYPTERAKNGGAFFLMQIHLLLLYLTLAGGKGFREVDIHNAADPLDTLKETPLK